jgi:hypothetical protein
MLVSLGWRRKIILMELARTVLEMGPVQRWATQMETPLGEDTSACRIRHWRPKWFAESALIPFIPTMRENKNCKVG